MKQLNLYYIGGSNQRPDGRTVVPTDDIQIWLKCAGLNKPYTALAEVLADSSTLAALISDSNAVDYLVRSKSFAKSEALVPTMTSDTTPEGKCICTDYSASDRIAFKAFDGDDNTSWRANGTTNKYIGYTFSTPKVCNKIRLLLSNQGDVTYITSTTHTIQGYDGNNWVTLDTFTNTAGIAVYEASFNNSNAYFGYRDLISGITWGGTPSIIVYSLQFYSEEGLTDNATAMSYIGLNNYASNTLLGDSTWCSAICNSTYFESVLNVKVPTMTSNTTPSGESFSGSALSVNLAYKAFDNDTSTEWISNYSSAFSTHQTDTIGYKFDNAVSIQKLYFHDYNPNYDFNMTYIFSGSNDGVTYTDLYTENTAKSVKNGLTQIINNSANYTYYRLTVTMWASSSNTGNHPRFDTLQFYGRADI